MQVAHARVPGAAPGILMWLLLIIPRASTVQGAPQGGGARRATPLALQGGARIVLCGEVNKKRKPHRRRPAIYSTERGLTAACDGLAQLRGPGVARGALAPPAGPARIPAGGAGSIRQ